MVVQFLYGLIFFSLGLAIMVQPRRSSMYDLARQLDWLAFFGFAHAFSDWGYLFIPLQATWAPAEAVSVFWILRACTAALSFSALFFFGLSLLVQPSRRPAWGLVPVFLLSVWFMIFVVLPITDMSRASPTWLDEAQVAYRYVLGFPAALLTAAGLWLQAGAVQPDMPVKHVRYLKSAAVWFVLYGFAAGLIVPERGFFPASVVNKNAFFQFFGVPVELVRGALMGIIAYYTVRLMDIFNIETQRRLQRMEQERALFREREQIARELHDGIMQTLYGTGLGLKQVIRLATTSPEAAAAITSELSQEIGRSIVQMRRFVLDLKDEGTTPTEICDEVRSLCTQVEQDAGFQVHIHTEGCANVKRRVPGGLHEDVMAVVREGLVAAVRAERTQSVSVVVSLDEDTFLVRVTIQNAHSPLSNACGLDGVRERVEGAGGLLQVLSDQGSESQLVAHLPISRGARPRMRESADS